MKDMPVQRGSRELEGIDMRESSLRISYCSLRQTLICSAKSSSSMKGGVLEEEGSMISRFLNLQVN